MIKRIISITLCAIIMCTGLLSVTASAAVTQNNNIKAPTIIRVGDPDNLLATNKTYYVTTAKAPSFELKLPSSQKTGSIYYWCSTMDKTKYVKYKGEKIQMSSDGTIKFFTRYNKQRSEIKTLKVKFITKAFAGIPGIIWSVDQIPQGTYKEPFEFMFGGFRPGTKVYYTTDGTKATTKSTEWFYGECITVDKDMTISVLAIHPDYIGSRFTYKFKIDPDAETTAYDRTWCRTPGAFAKLDQARASTLFKPTSK